jgi:glycine oxidase
MARDTDVLVIGGGIIGLTAAYFLAREGLRVTVIDQADLGQEASWAGAGIVPPGAPAAAQQPYEKLRALSTTLLPSLVQELRERTGVDGGYWRCGGLEFSTLSPTASEEWRAPGIVLEEVRAPALQQLEPALAAELSQAYHLPELAQIRNPRHLKALIAGCQLLGVALHPGRPALGWERRGERLLAVQTPAGPLAAAYFLLAAGSWSDTLLAPLGVTLGVRPVRGQIVLLNPGRPLLRKVLLWGPRYLVPRPEGRVLVGSTEEDAGFDKRTTAQAVQELLSLACQLVPALGQAAVERCWAGLRPGSPDGLPFLGPVPGYANLLIAAGHFRSGIQLAAGTALVLKEYLLGQPLTVPLEPFSPQRRARLGTVTPT